MFTSEVHETLANIFILAFQFLSQRFKVVKKKDIHQVGFLVCTYRALVYELYMYSV